jgi:4-hydroxy-tetrahydrodipicolinate synthase
VKRAEVLECDGVMLPVPFEDEALSIEYFSKIAKASDIPIFLYNTESCCFKSIESIQKLEDIDSIVGIKDSSMNSDFFMKLCHLRQSDRLRISVFQGMEHQMKVPSGCDGYVVALANVEPQLCREMLVQKSDAVNEKIIDLFWKYNLGGNWYITLKSILFSRNVFKSSEEAVLSIRPI